MTATNSRPRRRKTYHHGDLKETLLAAALHFAEQNGARALSLRELTRSAGVSHSAAYRHFPNKESLLAAIAEQGFKELGESMRAAAKAKRGKALTKLQACCVAYVDFGVHKHEQLNIMFGNLVTGFEAYPSLHQASTEAYEVLLQQVADGQAQGSMRSAPQPLLALLAWAMVHGLAQLLAGGKVPLPEGTTITHQMLTQQLYALIKQGISTR